MVYNKTTHCITRMELVSLFFLFNIFFPQTCTQGFHCYSIYCRYTHIRVYNCLKSQGRGIRLLCVLRFLNISHVLSQIHTGEKGGWVDVFKLNNHTIGGAGLQLYPLHFGRAGWEKKRVSVLLTDRRTVERHNTEETCGESCKVE